MNRRNLELVILSDIYLGSYACHSDELLEYLKSINPEKLVINGNFCNLHEKDLDKLPEKHQLIYEEIVEMAQLGTMVYLIPGRNDQTHKNLINQCPSRIQQRDKLELVILKKRYLIIPGNTFEIRYSSTSEVLNAILKLYHYFLKLSKWNYINRIVKGRSYKPLMNKLKLKFEKATKYIHDFEQHSANYAKQYNFDGIICGYINIPKIKNITIGDQTIHYLNSGDWVESLSSLEFNNERWSIVKYQEEFMPYSFPRLSIKRPPVQRAKKLPLKSFSNQL